MLYAVVGNDATTKEVYCVYYTVYTDISTANV